jgi:hypothetical protein
MVINVPALRHRREDLDLPRLSPHLTRLSFELGIARPAVCPR